MGGNRRYRELYDELSYRRIEEAAIQPRPVSLTPAELDVENDPIRRPADGEAVPVRSWVRYSEAVVDVRAEAFEWNSRGVHVRWTAPDGSPRDAWVYAGAVRRIRRDAQGRIAVRDRDLSGYFSRSEEAGDNPPNIGGGR